MKTTKTLAKQKDRFYHNSTQIQRQIPNKDSNTDKSMYFDLVANDANGGLSLREVLILARSLIDSVAR